MKTKALCVVFGFAGLVVLARIVMMAHHLGYGPVDFGVYRNVGNFVYSGQSIYNTEIRGEYIPDGLPFVYPPFAAVLLGPLALIPPHADFFLWTFLNAAALGLIVYYSLGHARAVISGRRYIFPALLVFSLFFNVSAQHFVFGQINFLIALMCLYDYLGEGRILPRGSLVGVAAGLKLTPLLFIAYFFARGQWRSAWASLISFTASVMVGLAVMPKDTWNYLTDKILRLSEVVELDNKLFATSGNCSIQGVSQRLIGTHSMLVILPAVIAIVATAFWGARRADLRQDPLMGASILGIASCLLSPVSWIHHWVWVFPAIIALLGRSRRATALMCGIAGICLFQATDLGDALDRLTQLHVLAELLKASMVIGGLVFLAYSLGCRSTLNEKQG